MKRVPFIQPHRGIILIHASKGKAGEIFASEKPFAKYIPDFKKLPFGAIIGAATITDCARIDTLNMTESNFDSLTLEQKAFGNSSSRFAWVLEEQRQFKQFYGAKGSLHFWNCPPQTEFVILKNEF